MGCYPTRMSMPFSSPASISLIPVAALVFGALGFLTSCASTGASVDTSSTTSHPLIGAPGPAFSADSVNGKGKVSLSALAGKITIVDFWATWCEPCKKSFPKLQDLNVKYKASGLEIVGISEDDDNSGIKEFGETYGAKFPLIWDDGKSIAGKWQVKSMPETFILDKKGVVRFAHLHFKDGEEVEIEKEVKSLMAGG
jgi:cytochrome c biogenesis protein CcmG/thiol:disulfide interchange protein DsbE